MCLSLFSSIFLPQVPDYEGNGLPSVDGVAKLFLPLFYLPLLFTVVFSLGALVYRIVKYVPSDLINSLYAEYISSSSSDLCISKLLFSMMCVLYNRSAIQWKRKIYQIKVSSFERDASSSQYHRGTSEVTTTEIDGPSLFM